MEANLKEAGLKTVEIQKVLGPLEKMTMLSVIFLISVFGRFQKGKRECGQETTSLRFIVYLFQWLNRFYCAPIWLDALLAPRCLSSVLLIRAVRRS
jgi:hypothetical protein